MRLIPFGKSRPSPEPAPEAPAVDWTEPLSLDPLGRLEWMEERLVAAGLPPVSQWWKTELGRFYRTQRRWMLVRAGRGSGKSTTIVRAAVAESLFAPRIVPEGQRHRFPFLSVSIADARDRVHEIVAVLGALSIEAEATYPQGHPSVEVDDARGNRIMFTARAANVASMSGPTTIGAVCDEESKWPSDGATPSREVLASLVATFRSRPVRAFRCSSVYAEDSTHALSIDAGDTDQNHVARIGSAFLPVAVAGLLEVALYEEQQHRDKSTAAQLRAYAAKLTAESPNVPSWVARQDFRAIDTRRELDALPAHQRDGLSCSALWQREIASIPDVTGSGAEAEAQCRLAAELNDRIARRGQAGPPLGRGGVMTVPWAQPGDARYAGAGPRQGGPSPGHWTRRSVF
jgi:hypothetical protein